MLYILLFLIIMLSASVLLEKFKSSKKKNTFDVEFANQQKIREVIQELNINNKKEYISNDFRNAIVFDVEKETVHLITPKHKSQDGSIEFQTSHFNKKDIISSEIVLDKQSISYTSRSSQLKGIAIGSLLAGGTGAIIGGLSANKSSKSLINEIKLRVKTTNINNPVNEIIFLTTEDLLGNKTSKGFKKEDSKLKAAEINVLRWQSIFDGMIHKNNKSYLTV